MTSDVLHYLESLPVSTLESLLNEPERSGSTLVDERESQAQRMSEKRRRLRDVQIPIPANVQRRLEAEASTEKWLRTYLPDLFYEDFTQDRRDMVKAIDHAAQYGGDQAIAGPRGEGKTTLAEWCAVKLMMTRKCDFPVVIGKSQGKSQLELKDIKERLQQSELFIADYPEICVPMQQVGAWSSRARMQTVGGKSTNIVLASDHLAFPTIGREYLPDDWPDEIEPASCGQVLYCLGVDGPIRGTKFRGKRPKLAILDDIESRESAFSDPIIAKNQDIIEKDVGGLGPSGKRVSRVMLCTIQNRKCIAYRYTDSKGDKSSWKGKRYRKMLQPPSRMDLVEQYIEMRKMRSDDDGDARIAHRFWKDNQELIEADCIVSNYQSYDKSKHPDGDPLEWSAVQAYYNRVADMGKDAVATEIDNDPPETIGPQGLGITPDLVSSRISGLDRYQLPANAISLTAAIDLGKYRCHWAVIAWWKGGGGCVVDYGVAEVTGTETINSGDKAADMVASEPHIYKALLQWRDELLERKYVDAAGAERKIDCVFVDSGTYTNAAYEFVRQVGGVFHAAKGVGNYRSKSQSTDKVKAGDNMHAAWLESAKLWLFELNTDYWKNWVHERFLTPTFDDEHNLLRRGSLSLYLPSENEKHYSYAQHIAAEELVTEFKEGKGARTFWNVKNQNNHWLDATYYAACAGRFTGVSLLSSSEVKNEPRHVDGDALRAKPSRQRPHHGTRANRTGWMQRVRRR